VAPVSGLLGTVQSAGDFAASVVVGLLWTLVSPAVGFGYAAAWMVAAFGAGWANRDRPTSAGHDGHAQRWFRGTVQVDASTRRLGAWNGRHAMCFTT
jgi:hypothetical protein